MDNDLIEIGKSIDFQLNHIQKSNEIRIKILINNF